MMSRFHLKVSRLAGQNAGTGLARAIGKRDIVPSRFPSRYLSRHVPVEWEVAA